MQIQGFAQAAVVFRIQQITALNGVRINNKQGYARHNRAESFFHRFEKLMGFRIQSGRLRLFFRRFDVQLVGRFAHIDKGRFSFRQQIKERTILQMIGAVQSAFKNRNLSCLHKGVKQRGARLCFFVFFSHNDS